MEKTIKIPAVKAGETFTLAGMEFIKLQEVDGKTPAVMKNLAFRSRFGSDNDFRSSKILQRLQKEVLPKIVEAVGEENVCMFETDLTTLDGLKAYGKMESRIGLPTFDVYRENVEIFDQHNPKEWWWLATADSVKPHCAPMYVLCVSPSGFVYRNCCLVVSGVRPFLIFKSSIFESFEA